MYVEDPPAEKMHAHPRSLKIECRPNFLFQHNRCGQYPARGFVYGVKVD